MIAGNSELPGAIFSPVFAEAPRLEWVHASQSDAGVLVTHNATVRRLFGADVRVNTRNLRVGRRNRGDAADHTPTELGPQIVCLCATRSWSWSVTSHRLPERARTIFQKEYSERKSSISRIPNERNLYLTDGLKVPDFSS